jgi:hypothetical protein
VLLLEFFQGEVQLFSAALALLQPLVQLVLQSIIWPPPLAPLVPPAAPLALLLLQALVQLVLQGILYFLMVLHQSPRPI